jgi:uncharacterized membrane protein YfcA
MKKTMSTEIIITVLLIGLSAGILSGLVGIGGGIVMVPAMVLFLNYTQHQAQGTSLAVLSLPVVILAALNYYQQCQIQGTPIDLKVVGLLAITFIFGAWAGGKFAMQIDQELLKKLFAALLFYTAFKMLNWDQAIIKLVKSAF